MRGPPSRNMTRKAGSAMPGTSSRPNRANSTHKGIPESGANTTPRLPGHFAPRPAGIREPPSLR